MKLKIVQTPTIIETKITIECHSITERVQHIITTIRNMEIFLMGYQDKTYFKIPIDSIYYIDTVDNQTYFYTKTDIYNCEQKLYILENKLSDYEFIRISKNTIVNLHQIEQVKSIGISRLEVVLINKEKLIVNRNYLHDFKQRFRI